MLEKFMGVDILAPSESDGLIVDSFAGGGGASTGIFMATGRHVDIAVNHRSHAMGMHRINHPFTRHFCEDVFAHMPEDLTGGREIAAGWFSPDCKFFSKARGAAPVNERVRGLAFVMLRWAKAGIKTMFMENVEEIVKWGPLRKIKGKVGLFPDPLHEGRTWQAFIDALTTGLAPGHPDIPYILRIAGPYVTKQDLVRGFGYKVEWRELVASDYGVPTTRKRLFMVCRRNPHRPIVWPRKTHANPAKNLPLERWRSIAECIDWSLPCHSIFLTREEGRKVNCQRPLAKATLARLARGTDKYVLKAREPFIVSLTHQGGDRVEPLSEPARTITGARRGEKALVVPVMTEMANASTGRVWDAQEPVRTICAQPKGGHMALIGATLVQVGYGERSGQAPRCLDPAQPVGTITTKGKVAACMIKLRGNNTGSEATTPGATITAGGNHHGVVVAHLSPQFGQSTGRAPQDPASTLTGVNKQMLVAAHVVQANGGFNTNPGHAADKPASTITSSGSQQQLSAAVLVPYYGTEVDGQAMDEAMRTIRTRSSMALGEIRLSNGLTAKEHAGALRCAAFLREHGVELESEYAMVGSYVVVDLCLRMLSPRELYRAMGFPEDYIIDEALMPDGKGGLKKVKLTKEQQTSMVGNAVPPRMAELLFRANCPELCVPERQNLMQ